MSKAHDVTDKSFEQQVLKADGLVLVDFGADWCPPCRAIGPIIDQIAEEQAEKMKVYKMDADDNPHTIDQYTVTGLPTLILFQGGKPVKRIVGAKPKTALMKDLQPYL